MRWLNPIEDRLHWLAVPGLFKYLSLFGCVIFAWQWADPDVASTIAFDRDAILSGEFWRIFTFAFAPLGVISFDAFGALILFFLVMIAFLISDSLEEVWGPTRTTLYVLTTWLGLVAGQFILGGRPIDSGSFLYLSMFLAFATLFPTYEFRLFFFLPVQVRWLGWLAFGGLVFSVLGQPISILLVAPTLLPYAIWILPDFLRDRKNLAQAGHRRRKFEKTSAPEIEAFHRCEVCKRTEHDDPHLEFRTLPDGSERCVDHLPEDPAA